MKLTVLGCGTSSGVPRIGGDWGQCDPANPKNRRRRVSVLVEHGETRILVDTTPDLREQLLSAGVGKLDAVFWTHDHADHAHGIDDLRGVTHQLGRKVACYADPPTLKSLSARFDYVFTGSNGYPAIATIAAVQPAHRIGGVTVRPFRLIHGVTDTTGYRFEADGRAFAYATDMNAIPLAAEPMLEGLDCWVVDALRKKPHPTHPHLALTLGWIAKYKPRRAILTHMDSSMDYASLAAELPPGVEPGFDGLVVDG